MPSYSLKIGDAFSREYEFKLEELKEKLRRAKEGLRDSIHFGTWKRVLDAGELIPFITCR